MELDEHFQVARNITQGNGIAFDGITAYFLSGQTIVNLDALMNRVEYFELMQQG